MMIPHSVANALGLAAAACTTLSFLPQVIRTYRTRSANDLSYAMLAFYALGIGLWLVYGLVIVSLPLIVSNIFTFALVVALLGLKIRFDWEARAALNPSTE